MPPKNDSPNINPAGTPLSRRVYLFLAALLAFALIATLAYYASAYVSAEAQRAAAAEAIVPPDPFEDVEITAESAFVYDMKAGRILYAKDAETPRPLASITKIMLALVAAETLDDDANITISERALATEGESGLVAGEAWHARDLIDFTLVVSSNDGAAALAEAAGRAIIRTYPGAPQEATAATVWRMNEKAAELGLTKTYFLDAHGLDESLSMAGAYGAAADIAALFAYAVRHESRILERTAYPSPAFSSLSGIIHKATNTNDALGDIPGIIGGKTGFTDLAGGNLGIVFDAGLSHPIVVVVLGSTQEARFTDVLTLAEIARKAALLK